MYLASRWRSTYPNLIKEITRGSKEDWAFRFTRNGVAIPVTGWKLYISFSTRRDGLIPDIGEFTFDPADAASGLFMPSLSDEETLAIPPGVYFNEVKYAEPNGNGELKTVDQGTTRVFQSANPRVTIA